ncbi:hypothetical protein [Pantoea sp. CCBC3-3-1]|uniref:hypothetical protein n=1 Tax=Pantoea sp. CCBC3-3-1 TaxID=2490851 RepID=UPI00143E0AAA|nr:hypothetical protein [Pantoea sp. CCBC3-3-1]
MSGMMLGQVVLMAILITWLLFVLRFEGWRRGKSKIITMAVLAVLLQLAIARTIYMH